MMDYQDKQPRYVHAEGHVDICFDASGKYLLTCGGDGDVRLLNGFDDDDPHSVKCAETVYAVAHKNERFYAACDDHTIRAYTFPEGEADGIITRFTAPVTALCCSHDGKTLVAGACDFTVKQVSLANNEQKQLMEHEAPVLSVAIHPRNHSVASSSCDGTIKIYSFVEEKVVKTITGIPKSNDFSQSKTLCRLAYDHDGKNLVIPLEKEIKIYSTETWQEVASLTHAAVKEIISLVALSPCGRYLVAACRDGVILVFDYTTRRCLNQLKHPKSLTITAMCWNPKKKDEIIYADNNGYVSLLDNFLGANTAKKDTDQVTAEELTDLFDDDDDDALVQATGAAGEEEMEEEEEEPQDIHELLESEAIQGDDGDDDDGEISTPFNKSKAPRIEDDDSNAVDLGALKKSFLGDMDETSRSSVTSSTAPAPAPAPAPAAPGFHPTPLQEAFQPSSTPTYLSHRYMVWNSVGVIVQYNTEEENSINIEFHDTATHHAMHVVNSLGHTMADMSHEAVVLACPPDTDNAQPSQLVCMHFSSWDNMKEWTIAMPDGEAITAVCLGEGWVAVATNERTVRLFSVGGIQREIFSVAGPIVAMAGHTHQLLITYHHAMGIPGNQCLGVRLVNVTGKKKTVIAGDHLPLSIRATLQWLGFTAEGTPLYVDSTGRMRMLSRKMGNNWTQVANLKKHAKGACDWVWVVSVHENPQQIRGVVCKGSRHPAAVPRPMLQLLPFQLPLCGLALDKGAIEENLNRSRLLFDHLDWWQTQGFEYDESTRAKATMAQQEALMKLFALACKSEREYRAVELCEGMGAATVQLAIKYASRLHLLSLAQRLATLAQTQQHTAPEEEDEEDEEEREMEVAQHRAPVSTVSKPKAAVQEEEVEEEEEDVDMDASQDIYEELDNEEQQAKAPVLLKSASKSEKMPAKIVSTSQPKKNPFKLGSQKTPTSGKGTSVFDSLEKPKSSGKAATKASPLNKPLPKPKIQKKKSTGGVQAKLFAPKKTQQDEVENVPVSSAVTTTPSGKTGFQLWLSENKEDLQEEHPDLSEADLMVEAAKAYKELSKEKKQSYQASVSEDGGKKRKREVGDEASSTTKKHSTALNSKNLSQNTAAKLASFSFGK